MTAPASRYLAGDLGIQIEDGFRRMLRRGDRLPGKARVTIRTGEDDQSLLEFSLVQRIGPAWNALLKHARIEGIPPRPRGKVKVRLEVDVDAAGATVARVRVPGRKGSHEIARSRAETATAEGLRRALTVGEGVGLVEHGLLRPGTTDSVEDPVAHACEECGKAIRLRMVSLVSPPVEGFTCEGCGNLLLVPSLDNMAASFFGDVVGGRLAPFVPAAAIDPDRLAAHADAVHRLEAALRPCLCGGRFRVAAPARCPDCGHAFVDYGGDLAFRVLQTHLPLVEGAEILTPRDVRMWTDDHLEPHLAGVRVGALEVREGYLTLPLRFRNLGGWLIVPLGYAAVLTSTGGEQHRAFRPCDFGDRPPATPEEWQVRQSEADAAYVAEVESALGIRPLLEAVEADAEVEGTLVFPALRTSRTPRGPLVLEIGHALNVPLA